MVESNPNRRGDTLLLGEVSMRTGDYAGALSWLNRAERLQPEARSELLLAISYQHMKNMDMASHFLDMAKKRAPNNPEVERSVGGYYRQIGKYPEAIAELKLIRNPNPSIKAELAYTYSLYGKLDEAARLYAEAANASPKDLGLQLSAAQAEIANGSIEHAAPFLQHATTLDPDYYRLHAIRGEIAQLENRDSDAAREYTAALTHLPQTPAEGQLYGIQLHMDLVPLFQRLKNESDAHHQLEIAQSEISAIDDHGPGRPQFLRLRALIKMNSGQLDSALAGTGEGSPLAQFARPQQSAARRRLAYENSGAPRTRSQSINRSSGSIRSTDLRSSHSVTPLVQQDMTRKRKNILLRLAKADPKLSYVPYLALGDRVHRASRLREG